MSEKQKADFLRKAMQQAKGDDLERANLHFGRWDDEKLDQQYGQSGQTCRQIWQGYKDERARWDASNALLEQLLSARGL